MLQIGHKTTESVIHCLCNHLTSFGGDLFVAPNPIDFDMVFAKGIGDNVAILMTVLAFFLTYLLSLVFARRADKRNQVRVFLTCMYFCIINILHPF